jgi:hypothetical protein
MAIVPPNRGQSTLFLRVYKAGGFEGPWAGAPRKRRSHRRRLVAVLQGFYIVRAITKRWISFVPS